jgi:hypothetical protein
LQIVAGERYVSPCVALAGFNIQSWLGWNPPRTVADPRRRA